MSTFFSRLIVSTIENPEFKLLPRTVNTIGHWDLVMAARARRGSADPDAIPVQFVTECNAEDLTYLLAHAPADMEQILDIEYEEADPQRLDFNSALVPMRNVNRTAVFINNMRRGNPSIAGSYDVLVTPDEEPDLRLRQARAKAAATLHEPLAVNIFGHYVSTQLSIPYFSALTDRVFSEVYSRFPAERFVPVPLRVYMCPLCRDGTPLSGNAFEFTLRTVARYLSPSLFGDKIVLWYNRTLQMDTTAEWYARLASLLGVTVDTPVEPPTPVNPPPVPS